MPAVLQVATPQGDSGKILTSAGDYLFRYHEDAQVRAAISLLMPVRLDEYRHRELHPIFQMNLPEGYVLEQLRNRLAKVASVDPMLLWRCLAAARRSGGWRSVRLRSIRCWRVSSSLAKSWKKSWPGMVPRISLLAWWIATSCVPVYRAYSPRYWCQNIRIPLHSASPRKPLT